MLFNTYSALEKLTDYTKLPDGTWRAELRVPRLRVTGITPSDCRHRLADEFDALLADWLVRAQTAPNLILIGKAECTKVRRD